MSKIMNTLRLNDQQVQEMLDELEAKQDSERNSQRKSRRWSLGVTKIVISVADGATNWVHHLAVARNMSSGGAAVMIGAYVHSGTSCQVCIRDRNGAVQQVSGRVVRCSHVHGRVHELGVAFDEPVRTGNFIEFGKDEYVFDAEHVDPDDLKGHLLIVEGDRAEQKLIAYHYRNTHLDLEFAGDGETALSILQQCLDIDFILAEYQLSDMNGVHFTERARAIGYGGALVILTADSKSDLRSTLIASGADELLHKPCSEDLLLRATQEYLFSTNRDGFGPIDCTNAELPPQLICEYIDEMAGKCEHIADAIEQDDFSRLRDLVMQIRSSSPNFGLSVIGDLAAETLKHLDASMSISESMEELQRLQLTVRRVRRPVIDDQEVS